MIVCSCNALTDTDIVNAVHHGADRPFDVYASRNCRAKCGNCVPGVLCVLRDAMKARAARAQADRRLSADEGHALVA